jgi:cytochrome c553
MRTVIAGAIVATVLLVLGAVVSSAQTIEERAAVCTACHGEDGRPKMPEVPIIWGQHAGYLYIQLRDFKLGTRKSEIMQPLVAEFEKPDMLAIAEYFAKKPWPTIGYKPAEADNKTGERVNATGMCTECHLGGFLGDGTVPRLAGQTVPYLEKTMLDFKTRKRANNPDKSTLLASYPDDELAAMARYLAGQ